MSGALAWRDVLRRAVIGFAAAGAVSLLAAANLIGTAALTGSLGWAVVGGLVAGALSSWALGAILRRRERWRQRPVMAPMMLFGGAALLSLSWLLPCSGGLHPGPVAGVEWLTRPDGSQLAIHLTRATAATRPPLIIVHGGPGVADMAHDAQAFAALATDRDVYVYDRIGTGASTRLADPTRYTTGRAVQDLEAVRAYTGAPRVVLHGHSWGARIAAAYAQEHSERVAALVLSAPGDLPLDGAAVPPGDLTTRLNLTQKTGLYLRLARPRNLFTYALTAADARVAQKMAGDVEMDRRFAAIYRDSTPALFCDQRLVNRVGTSGVGFYAHYVPQLHPDPVDDSVSRRRLTAVKVPVLLIKPACDYLPWSTAGYRRAFPQARLVMLPDAGHTAYLEQPALYRSLVRAFLAGEELPLPILDGDTIPAGYRGTR